jgi:transposase
MTKYTTIGIDLGDKNHVACVIDKQGNEIMTKRFTNTKDAIAKFMRNFPAATVTIEASSHSPWISRLLEKLGHKVHVANPRKLRCIWDSVDKTDLRDARMLARIARFDPQLLCAISHRGEEAQLDLQVIKARDSLVETRARLVNSVRSSVKSTGERLPKGWGTKVFAKKALCELPEQLLEVFRPLLEAIVTISEKIAEYDRKIEKLSEEKYPETENLRQISGVGPVTSLAFVLTIEDPKRFRKSREVGPFLGLVPKRDQSGNSDKQLHISKAGNTYLRRLLINCSQYILGPFGKDCFLRRHGEKIAERGGKNAKKRAVVAVARKLAVVLHQLWISGNKYEEFHNLKKNLPERAA